MLNNNGYYEFELWNGHKLQVWVEGRLAILNHPYSCSVNDDECREKILKYIHNEGLFDDVIDMQIILLDSYREEK